MKFQREFAPEIFNELEPLLLAHYLEIAHYQDIELKPDWQAYENLEKNGALRVFTARNDEGLLLGYGVYFMRYNIHYKDSLQAVQDILFIDKKHRGFGAKFILWCDEQLREEKVQVVYHHVKKEHNFGPLLERFGYQLVDEIYGRRLDQ